MSSQLFELRTQSRAEETCGLLPRGVADPCGRPVALCGNAVQQWCDTFHLEKLGVTKLYFDSFIYSDEEKEVFHICILEMTDLSYIK